MKVGKKYKLNVPYESFVEKTWKRDFAYHLRDSGGVCSPSSIDDTKDIDIALFCFNSNPGIEFEIPGDMWKYFDEVEVLEQESSKSGEFTSSHVDIKEFKNLFVDPKQFGQVIDSKQNEHKLNIETEYGDKLTSFKVSNSGKSCIGLFMLDHIFSKVPTYVLPDITSPDERLKEAKSIADSHYRLNTINHLIELLNEEKKKELKYLFEYMYIAPSSSSYKNDK